MSPTITGVARFRTQRIEVEAIRYTGENRAQVIAFLADNPYEQGYEFDLGDSVVRDEDGTFEIFTESAFKAEFEPVVETEYGWDGIITEHPQADQFRLPLVGTDGDDAVLVLDREYLLLLAVTIRDLLGGGDG